MTSKNIKLFFYLFEMGICIKWTFQI